MMHQRTALLKAEFAPVPGTFAPYYYRYLGFKKGLALPLNLARANAIEASFTEPTAYVYANDLIAGCIRPLYTEEKEDVIEYAARIDEAFGGRNFGTNNDHFSPDYEKIVSAGIPGLFREIEASEKAHAEDAEKLEFLCAMRISVTAFRQMILNYADAAAVRKAETEDAEIAANMERIEQNCRAVADHAPTSFMEALQLVWLCHVAFLYEGRYAMSLARIDQYLYPFYQKDIASGAITRDRAVELFENVFMKIYEKRILRGGDDVVNICIGGTSPDGSCDVNELSFCVLEAVGNCNVPGPNLSARVSPDTPDEFLDACLRVIGTGLGYPALMNDAVHIPALERMGYAHEDVCNFTMVGCIENFITGMQPPWSDGRFDSPRFLEFVFNNGRGIMHPSFGLPMGDVEEIDSMEEFMHRYEAQLAYGADEYYRYFSARNDNINHKNFTNPFLSCFCRDCIGRALDINCGGAVYPSVHGAVLMGIGTVADALAAIEKVVFVDHEATLRDIGDAMRANFVGYEELRQKLLAAPKYGNNDDFVDKYAVWFVDYQTGLFDRYRTRDGGRIYTAIAANTSNIYAGRQISATPDGRMAGEPLSDAASPTYGRDTRGVTATIQSITKPDYTKVACGTVVNQKFSPSMFEDEKRKKLLTLLKTYLRLGGQEMQINATSRETLIDAMEHPENYGDLVVRVSGFSAYYVTLGREVQLDILNRTQQG